MTPEELELERLKSAATLDRTIEGAHSPELARTSASVLGPAHTVGSPPADELKSPDLPAWKPPAPPDLGPVNESFRTAPDRLSGSFFSLIDGREKTRQAQQHFNSNQVRLDNALVTWTAEHFAATHKHYDAVIGQMQKRMDEIDLRHLELERELVRHVHEMARRIDVVLGEGEKGRVSHEAALRSLRERLRALEEKLPSIRK